MILKDSMDFGVGNGSDKWYVGLNLIYLKGRCMSTSGTSAVNKSDGISKLMGDNDSLSRDDVVGILESFEYPQCGEMVINFLSIRDNLRGRGVDIDDIVIANMLFNIQWRGN